MSFVKIPGADGVMGSNSGGQPPGYGYGDAPTATTGDIGSYGLGLARLPQIASLMGGQVQTNPAYGDDLIDGHHSMSSGGLEHVGLAGIRQVDGMLLKAAPKPDVPWWDCFGYVVVVLTVWFKGGRVSNGQLSDWNPVVGSRPGNGPYSPLPKGPRVERDPNDPSIVTFTWILRLEPCYTPYDVILVLPPFAGIAPSPPVCTGKGMIKEGPNYVRCRSVVDMGASGSQPDKKKTQDGSGYDAGGGSGGGASRASTTPPEIQVVDMFDGNGAAELYPGGEEPPSEEEAGEVEVYTEDPAAYAPWAGDRRRRCGGSPAPWTLLDVCVHARGTRDAAVAIWRGRIGGRSIVTSTFNGRRREFVSGPKAW